MLQADTLLNGRYRIVEPVGEGGMAVVYRAVDTRLGRTVAVKVLHPQYARDEPFLLRFQQEAEFAASLGAHPNIVDIYDIGQDEDLHYIVMEFVEGHSLKDLMVHRHRFTVPDAFTIGAQVASALAFAHQRGLVHRDVKPQNILVTHDGTAKVTDFGIARSASASQMTRTGVVIGTVHYFSPEQAQGKQAGPPTDIYSLGVILYEMLTGHLPFDAETPIGVAMQHVHSTPPSPWEYVPTLSAQAVATVMRALEKDPDARYRDADEFAAALNAQRTEDMDATTVVTKAPSAPVMQQTTVLRTVDSVPPRRVVRPARSGPVQPAELPSTSRRTMWLALGGVLLLLAIAAGAYLASTNAFGGSSPPATATATAAPSPTPRAKPKPSPTRIQREPTSTIPAYIPPTSPPVYPTNTSTPPSPTPIPTVAPTETPQPIPTDTPQPINPTPIPTLVIPSPTPVG